VQNGWNGSAKVALISLERWEAAWRTIGTAVDEPQAITFADALLDLRRSLADEFPDAVLFMRPGFDETWTP
jgi:hypothetical protein